MPVLGHALIWPGRAIYVGRLLENDAHAHHAIQISIALEGTLALQADPAGPWLARHAVATAPDQRHRLRCDGPIAQIYLDPESEAGLSVRERIGDGGMEEIDVGDRDSLAIALAADTDGGLDAQRVARTIDAIAQTAGPDVSRRRIDPRVEEALATMHASAGHHLALGALADQVALSPSRFGVVFRRDTGIPVRRYLLWLRLIDAIEAFSAGDNLTQAAHGAGFADSAHLSRTFHRMFGMTPSTLQHGNVEIRTVTDA